MEKQLKDRINYGPDRSKSSPKIGKTPNSAFTKVKQIEHFKLPRLSKKDCIVS